MKTYYDKFNGRDVYLYTIKSDMVEVDICELGARINSIRVNGVDIALGFAFCFVSVYRFYQNR